MARQRPREFQNLNQALRDCTLYFDHTFLCRGSGRKYDFYVGRVHGSTVFHQARRQSQVSKSTRWYFVSSERFEHATGQLSAKLHLKDQLLTSLSGFCISVNTHTIARGCWLRMRKCLHPWGESGRETITGIERCRRQFAETLMLSQVVTTTNLSISSGAGTKSVNARTPGERFFLPSRAM